MNEDTLEQIITVNLVGFRCKLTKEAKPFVEVCTRRHGVTNYAENTGLEAIPLLKRCRDTQMTLLPNIGFYFADECGTLTIR